MEAIFARLTEAFLVNNVRLFVLTLVFAIPLGLVISFGSMSRIRPLAWVVKTFVWIIRGTPLMLQILIIYFGPGLLEMAFHWPRGNGGRMVAAVVAFAVNYACYFSEIYRGGIESMPDGQYEAAKLLGYSKAQTFIKIILPQVIKRILPSITNEVITLVKDTSLAFAIAVTEMFTQAKALSSSQVSMIPYVAAGVFYYVFNLLVASVMEFVEKKFNYYR